LIKNSSGKEQDTSPNVHGYGLQMECRTPEVAPRFALEPNPCPRSPTQVVQGLGRSILSLDEDQHMAEVPRGCVVTNQGSDIPSSWIDMNAEEDLGEWQNWGGFFLNWGGGKGGDLGQTWE
jgi:hypothetical protein